MPDRGQRNPERGSIAFLAVAGIIVAAGAVGRADELDLRLARDVKPLVARYCHDCHAGDAVEGDVDLATAGESLASLQASVATWQRAREVIHDRQMPPADSLQPTDAEREVLEAFLRDFLRGEAIARAGDPGPVVLRRLDNAEYTYTVRDLTGVATLDPAREFPTDGAAGEGFSNTGQALVMSPALAEKFLDAAKGIASHAMLLPDGLRFSAGVSRSDWTDENLGRLRAFYRRYTAPIDGAMETVAQGIALDLGHEGGLPIARYLTAARAEAEPLAEGQFNAVARGRGLSIPYLASVWRAVAASDTGESPLLDAVRRAWREAKPEDPDAGDRIVKAAIAPWQRVLWKFNPVGQVARQFGRPDGPASWMEPVDSLAARREFRVALTVPEGRDSVVVRLVSTDAGDGHEDDVVVWENPRLVAAGVPDLHARFLRAEAAAVDRATAMATASAGPCLEALGEAEAVVASGREPSSLAELGDRHGVDPRVLAVWSDLIGPSPAEPPAGFLLTDRATSVAGHESVKGWTGPQALSILANAGAESLKLPGTFKPGGVVMHPAPDRRAVVAWRSPRRLAVRVSGVVEPVHAGCGNGIVWRLEVRRGATRHELVSGTSRGTEPMPFGPFDDVVLRRYDRLCLMVEPRDGDHACDSTAVDLAIEATDASWNLAAELAMSGPNRGIAAANPLADPHGYGGAWEFGSEITVGPGWSLPAGSALDRWLTAAADDRQPLAAACGRLLGDSEPPESEAADHELRDRLLAAAGPLVPRLAALDPASTVDEVSSDPVFGRHPSGGGEVAETDLCVRAPGSVTFEIPARLAAGREFVVAARMHEKSGGCVQAHVLTDETAPLQLDPATPIIAAPGGMAWQRFESALTEFRELFPPAVCYARIVPVDEVITLNVFYREDDRLRRLLLDADEAAELDRLWDELLFVSQEPFRLRDAHEQLIQFATQDRGDLVGPFTAMKPAIEERAEAFTKRLTEAEPAHVDAVVAFAARAWRRPLKESEAGGLRALYATLRSDGLAHDEAVRLLLARVLVAPAFLYKLELPGPGSVAEPVTGRELATRLSYFLWSSLPDERLTSAAERLQEPERLVSETRRMLRDPRIRRLAVEFGTHWLHVHGFDAHDEKSETEFPEFAGLREAMHEEAVLLLTDLFEDDRSILSLIDADHTFLDESLARHYGIPGVTGAEWRRVEGVREHGRGGVLTLAATLAKQSGASRTSPILRGTWFTEGLLGQKLPKPPKNVPPLAEALPAGLSERELTALHSTHPACAGCHAGFDPYGFALEEFDAIGRRRGTDVVGRPIDAAAVLPDGTRVLGAEDLRRHLSTVHAAGFERQFIRKLLGFALGRGVQLSDEPLLDDIQARLASADHRVGVAVEAIVESPQFRRIRGREQDEP